MPNFLWTPAFPAKPAPCRPEFRSEPGRLCPPRPAFGQRPHRRHSIDDRAGCAALIALAAARKGKPGPTLHLVWSVQEEYNLRGVLPAAERLKPDIALQIDLLLACDTPDMAHRGEVTLGGGPGISLYSFHGRGTLNGVIPHPALVRLMETAASAANLPCNAAPTPAP